VSGRPPLLEVRPNSRSAEFARLTEDEQDKYLQLARNLMFFAEANKISFVSANQTHVLQKYAIKPNHPLVFAVTQKLEPFLGIDDNDYDSKDFNFHDAVFDDYSIYNNWIKGSYRNMLRIPSIDSYKFRTKGHKISKSKYLVQKMMLKLVVSNNTTLFLQNSIRKSDEELYNIGLLELQDSFQNVSYSSNKGVDDAIKKGIKDDIAKMNAIPIINTSILMQQDSK
jgi:hypothetical protein